MDGISSGLFALFLAWIRYIWLFFILKYLSLFPHLTGFILRSRAGHWLIVITILHWPVKVLQKVFADGNTTESVEAAINPSSAEWSPLYLKFNGTWQQSCNSRQSGIMIEILFLFLRTCILLNLILVSNNLTLCQFTSCSLIKQFMTVPVLVSFHKPLVECDSVKLVNIFITREY